MDMREILVPLCVIGVIALLFYYLRKWLPKVVDRAIGALVLSAVTMELLWFFLDSNYRLSLIIVVVFDIIIMVFLKMQIV